MTEGILTATDVGVSAVEKEWSATGEGDEARQVRYVAVESVGLRCCWN